MKHQIVVDLGYGDSGKGITVARLCEEVPNTAVIRFSGGAQAAHNVITDDGRHHTFAQFGAGTFTPGVFTHLSKHFLIELDSLHRENEHLKSLGVADALDRLTVDPRALVITPYAVEFNRQAELHRGDNPHGSCARGIGATVEYELAHPHMGIRLRDLAGPSETLLWKLECQQNWLINRWGNTASWGIKAMMSWLVRDMEGIKLAYDFDRLPELNALTDRLVFEGSQGVLLDEHAGFHPHTTWSTTTPHNAVQLIEESNLGEYEVLGVIRTYMTRHGHGPFVTEDKTLSELPELHNEDGRWMGAFRRGHMDIPAVRYAIEACGRVDKLVITHADIAATDAIDVVIESSVPYKRLPPGDLEARAEQAEALKSAFPSPRYTTATGAAHVGKIVRELGVPLYMTGHGPKIGQYRSFTGVPEQVVA